MSLDEAVARYSWNDDFATAITFARKAAPEVFAAAEIVDATNAWVSFTNDPPAEALEAVNAFVDVHPEVDVRVRADAAISETDLEATIESAHFAVLKTAPVVDATTSFDATTQQLTSTVVLAPDTPDEAVAELVAEASAAVEVAGLEGVLEEIVIKVKVSDDPVLGGVDSNNEHLGGELLDGPTCTSGFVVANDAGFRGVSTAGHCDGPTTDDGVGLTFPGQHIGGDGDVEWRSGPRGRPPDFYAGNVVATEVTRRTVAAVNSPVPGQGLCKNGRTNHAQCQEVRLLNLCNGYACSLVQMNARLAAPGDSGGPVYWGNNAYGLHQGWVYDPSWPFDRDAFSRADLLPSALGVSVVK